MQCGFGDAPASIQDGILRVGGVEEVLMSQGVKRHFPEILIDPVPIPIAFLDTFVWGQIVISSEDVRSIIAACCKERHVIFAITSAIEGELSQRNFLEEVQQLCGDSLMSIPVGRITANQIVHGLVCYERMSPQIVLTWERALSEVPILDHPIKGLRDMSHNLADELNKASQATDAAKEELVSILMSVEREQSPLVASLY